MTEPNPDLRVEQIAEPVPFEDRQLKMVTYAQLRGDGSINFSGFVGLESTALCAVAMMDSRDAVKRELLIKLGNLHDAVGNLLKKVNHG